MEYALIENSIVVNTIAWDGIAPIGNIDLSKLVSISDLPRVTIGWSYIDGEFIPPEEDALEPEDNMAMKPQPSIDDLQQQIADLQQRIDALESEKK
jgi:hypothetical protein